MASCFIFEKLRRMIEVGTFIRARGELHVEQFEKRRGAPMRSAYHSSLTLSGSQRGFGKFVVRSSTSTNSTSLAYRWGLRKARFSIRESLKCRGFCGSRLRARKVDSLA